MGSKKTLARITERFMWPGVTKGVYARLWYFDCVETCNVGPNSSIYYSKGEFVQMSNDHWVTISNIGCKPGTVNVFDSIPNNSVSSLLSETYDIQLQFKQVQVQRGNSDCGVFAVAFATALCPGKDPSFIRTAY